MMDADNALDWRLNAYRPDLADIRLQGQVQALRFVEGTSARISAAAAPLLRRPVDDAAMDSQLLHGENLSVFECQDGWAWVQSETDGYVGYLHESALSTTMSAPTHKIITGQTVVLSDREQIAAPLHSLSLGAQVTVVEEGERFHRLATGGFVFAAHLAPLDYYEDDWVAVAERFLGLPYLWGGRGYGGIDCSGLVQVSLALCGHAVLRDSDQQANTIGESIALDPSTWEHGDLLFTRGHVLIAHAGISVIHATGHRWSVVTEERNLVISSLYGKEQPVISARRL